MLFWKKSPKVKVRCYSPWPQLIDLFPVEETKKFTPQWFKNVDPYVNYNRVSGPTIKVCPGFNDLYKRGFVVPLWEDYKIKWSNSGLMDVVTPNNRKIELQDTHPVEARGGAFKGWTHVKLHNVWMFETDRVVPFMLIDTTWNREDHQNFIVPPGVVEFKYQHALNINMFLPPLPFNQTKEIEIAAGTPMIQLVPLEPVDLEIECIPADDKKLDQLRLYRWTFNGVYLKTKKYLQRDKT
jgi:hypothetical protein